MSLAVSIAAAETRSDAGGTYTAYIVEVRLEAASTKRRRVLRLGAQHARDQCVCAAADHSVSPEMAEPGQSRSGEGRCANNASSCRRTSQSLRRPGPDKTAHAVQVL